MCVRCVLYPVVGALGFWLWGAIGVDIYRTIDQDRRAREGGDKGDGQCRVEGGYGAEVQQALELLRRVQLAPSAAKLGRPVKIREVDEQDFVHCWGSGRKGATDVDGNIFVKRSIGGVPWKAAIIAHEIIHAAHRQSAKESAPGSLLGEVWHQFWDGEEAEAHAVGDWVAASLLGWSLGLLADFVYFRFRWAVGILGGLLVLVAVVGVRGLLKEDRSNGSTALRAAQ